MCDYLCRDEAQAVLRLEVYDSPQIVLASLNLLSALLGCCECATLLIVCVTYLVNCEVCSNQALLPQDV